MFRHPQSSQGCTCHLHEPHNYTALKDIPSSTRDPRTALEGGHPTTHLGTVPKNGREQTQELHLSKVPRNAKVLFDPDIGDELFEIVRRAGRLRAFADWNDEMSERGWVHRMVFGASFYLIPSAYSVLTVAPSVWICAHPLSARLVLIVEADAVSQRLRGSSACCVRAHPGTRCAHESNMHETGTCLVILLRTRRSSCLHQALYARHAIDAGSLCSIDSVSSWPSLLSKKSSLFSGFHDISSLLF